MGASIQHHMHNSLHGYVAVRSDQLIKGGHSNVLECYITGNWKANEDAFFENQLEFDTGVDMLNAVVQPFRSSRGTLKINLVIHNRSEEEFMIKKHTIVGRLSELEQIPESVGNVHNRSSQLAIYNIASDVAYPLGRVQIDDTTVWEGRSSGSVFHLAAEDVGNDGFCYREVSSRTLEPRPPDSAMKMGVGCKPYSMVSLSGIVEDPCEKPPVGENPRQCTDNNNACEPIVYFARKGYLQQYGTGSTPGSAEKVYSQTNEAESTNFME